MRIVDGSHLHFGTSSFTVALWLAPEELDRRVMGKEDFPTRWWVVNLLKNGTAEEQAANRAYGLAMLGAMAEGGYGPMHAGRAFRGWRVDGGPLVTQATISMSVAGPHELQAVYQKPGRCGVGLELALIVPGLMGLRLRRLRRVGAWRQDGSLERRR